jgi:hypothetical protein
MAEALRVTSSGATDAGTVGSGSLPLTPSNTYDKTLFDKVFQSIEREIPPTIGIDGKIRNRTAIKASESTMIAALITERVGKAPDVTAAKLLDDPVATPVQVGATNVAQAPAARRTLLQRLLSR